MNEHHVWDARRSVTLTIVVTWVGLVAGVAMIPLLIPLLRCMVVPGTIFNESFVTLAVGPLYVCLAAGLVALIVLLMLLYDVRRGEVFTARNVSRLRLISYCGFLIMAACVVGTIIAPPRPVFAFLAVVAGFLGLIMRVVKNIIDTARLLKEDADYTI